MLPASLARACALAGDRQEAERLLDDLREQECISYFHAATAHLALGQDETAFQCLRHAYDQGEMWVAFRNVDPRLDALRGGRRYRDLVELLRL